jgi:hypothetical protein
MAQETALYRDDVEQGATAICGVAKHACGAVAAAGRVVGSGAGDPHRGIPRWLLTCS